MEGVIPADLVAFMRFIGLLEVAAQTRPPINWAGTWYKDCEPPF
jgi:hypothetical protein